MNNVLLSSNKMDYCTPQKLFDELNTTYHFGLDAAASPENAKCKKYFTKDDDALKQSWKGYGWVFCNPPYGRQTGAFVKKAYDECKNGVSSILLIPSRTDTSYFHDYILHSGATIQFIRGRLKFEDPDGRAYSSAPFPSMIVVFESGDVNES